MTIHANKEGKAKCGAKSYWGGLLHIDSEYTRKHGATVNCKRCLGTVKKPNRSQGNKLIPVIKAALAKKYGYKNVSVKNGQGTAWGWVNASVRVPQPKKLAKDCANCQISTYGRCYDCGNILSKITDEAKKIAYEAVKKANLHFYTYSSDDGYGTERSEFLLDISYV